MALAIKKPSNHKPQNLSEDSCSFILLNSLIIERIVFKIPIDYFLLNRS